MSDRTVFFSFKFEDEKAMWKIRDTSGSFGWDTAMGIPELNGKKYSAAAFEDIKPETDEEITQWINKELDRSEVICVIAGQHTFESRWVRYEIDRAYYKDKGMMCICLPGKDPHQPNGYQYEPPPILLASNFFQEEYGLLDVNTYDAGTHDWSLLLGHWLEQAYEHAQVKKNLRKHVGRDVLR